MYMVGVLIGNSLKNNLTMCSKAKNAFTLWPTIT